MFDALREELAANGSVHFYVRAVPGAAKTMATEVLADDSIKVRIAAPAEYGKANVELLSFIARQFGVGKSQVEIVSGSAARQKLVKVTR